MSFWDEINADFVAERSGRVSSRKPPERHINADGSGLAWDGDALMNATRNAVHEALEESAHIVARLARALCPKDTGELADSIEVAESKFKDGGFLVIAQGPGNYDDFYATFVELGTHKTKAQPFLRPALYNGRNLARDRFKDILK